MLVSGLHTTTQPSSVNQVSPSRHKRGGGVSNEEIAYAGDNMIAEAIHNHIDQALTTYHQQQKYPFSSNHKGEIRELNDKNHFGSAAKTILRYHLYHETFISVQVPNYDIKEDELKHTTRLTTDIYFIPDSTIRVNVEGSFTDMEAQIDVRNNKWIWAWSDWYSPRINLTNPIDADTKWTGNDALELRIPSHHRRSSLTLDLNHSDSIDRLMKAVMSMVYHQRNQGSLISIQATRISNMLLIAKKRKLPLTTRLLAVEGLAPFIWYKYVDGLLWPESTPPVCYEAESQPHGLLWSESVAPPEYYDTE